MLRLQAKKGPGGSGRIRQGLSPSSRLSQWAQTKEQSLDGEGLKRRQV